MMRQGWTVERATSGALASRLESCEVDVQEVEASQEERTHLVEFCDELLNSLAALQKDNAATDDHYSPTGVSDMSNTSYVSASLLAHGCV